MWVSRTWLFSLDHKKIGLAYGVTAIFFLLLGLFLMMLLRWQLAFPGQALPLLGIFLQGGVISPELYNQLGAMHGTIMVFLGVVPMGVGAYGNYLIPLQIGARDMAFPRLNLASYWLYLAAGLIMLLGFALPGGTANSGWTSYPPLADIATAGQTVWLIGILLLSFSSALGSLNFIVTILHLRTAGMTLMRLPLFVWAQLVTAVLLLLAFPTLAAASILQLMDRLVDTSFFLPSGLVVGGQILNRSGGGNPLLWQHLFWFLAHPEVYVLILPAIGIVAEILATYSRKAIYGYKTIVYSFLILGALSFLVWAHHMFLTNMGTAMSVFFQATTLIISIPSIIVLSHFALTLWGGSLQFDTAALFALAFIPLFGLGGLTGLPLGLMASDLHLHDTYYVIAHFHYIVAPGTLFALFAGVYYWYPKITGRLLNETLGKIHFYASLLFMNGVFLPMFFMGLAGASRRIYDFNIYAHSKVVQPLNLIASTSSWLLALAQLPFLWNIFASLRKGRRSELANPWGGTTLEWTTPSPTPDHNFADEPNVIREPYVYVNNVPSMQAPTMRSMT